MRTFRQYLDESINDKGILKAIFVVGLPGAGKSYTIKQLHGVVSPRIVNTDKAAEFLATKWGKIVTSTSWAQDFKDTAHRMTSNTLLGYVDGMLPLFVDGTSNDPSNILHRMGILKSLGYDIGVVFVNADVELAIERAAARAATSKREVDVEFIRKVARDNRANVSYLKNEASFYREITNNGVLDDDVMQEAFTKVAGFFAAPVKNPIGSRMLDEMREKKVSYLSDMIPRTVLAKKIEGWYKG